MAGTPFVWPLGTSTTPDEMNTSYGPRIDADRWDFHDGIDLPERVGKWVHAMATGEVVRAGPADTMAGHGFSSRHVVQEIVDPADGKKNLYLVYLHLDSIAEGVFRGAMVNQGQAIGTVGQDDAMYPHLHFEFRKGSIRERNSRHPLGYLPYSNTSNLDEIKLSGCNFHTDENRAVRIGFVVSNRREGDVLGIEGELSGQPGAGVLLKKYRVDFNDRNTIASEKGDQHQYKNEIAVEGYQKSNMKGDGLDELNYGVIIKDITSEYKHVKLWVLDALGGKSAPSQFGLPMLATDKKPVHNRIGLEGPTFPPPGWQKRVVPNNVCRADKAAALVGDKGLLCQDLQSPETSPLVRAGLRFALPTDRVPVRPMSWRLGALLRPAELDMDKGHRILPLALMAGGRLVAAACLSKIRDDEVVAGVVIRSADGFFREKIDVAEGEIYRNEAVKWEIELLRIGTRQTTAVLRLDDRVVARVNGDTTGVEPDAGCLGIMHRHNQLQLTLHFDQLLLTEELR